MEKKTPTTDININVDYYREIYNEWDFSPLNNSDLDDDLFEYLEESASEIPKKHKIRIIFHIPPSIQDTEKEKKGIEGMRNYFNYYIKKYNYKLKLEKRNSVAYGIFGLFLLFIGSLLERIIPEVIFADFLIEGFFIGGWVLFWELFSTLFFRQGKINERISNFKRLFNADIIYIADRSEQLFHVKQFTKDS
ncbi:MAG: hypothetical protein Q8P20_07445 [bacterium]|nr:hypothetical protein [bacterium]